MTLLPLCRFALILVGLLTAELALGGATATIDLSGEWRVRLDPDDVGESQRWFAQSAGEPIKLPGVATQIGLGEPLTLDAEPGEEVFAGLHQRYSYIGPAWYTREITVPDSWDRGDATLALERVLWKSDVWVNGERVGSENSLSTPHRHRIDGLLKPGKNLIAMRIDNRQQVDIGKIGHAYTNWTQTIWNGAIGELSLERSDDIVIDHLSFCPQTSNGQSALTIELRNNTQELRVEKITVRMTAENHEGADLAPLSESVEVSPGSNRIEIAYRTDGAAEWSEFSPALYRLECAVGGASKGIVTGLRCVAARDRKLLVNGRPTFLRGTLECCIFPKTGYPPTTVAGWDRVFKTARKFGLNHIRFHSWCPPEAAFESADRNGVYLQIELPNWTFKMGQRPKVDGFLDSEGERILRAYSHHPSLVLLSLGNELNGDLQSMDAFVSRLRKRAPHILYTSTTYSFSERGELPGSEDDFFITQKSKSGWVRGQGFLNQTKPNTESDYRAGLECLDIPLISHEVGQYHVYPNLAELPKYDGLLRALNFEAIASDLEEKGRLHEAAEYTKQSGKLAAALYKEDIERALRTPDLSGIQLLDLNDFSGQGTATVGLLDAFWESKGAITAEEFRRFCSPVVPLLRLPSRTWKSSETLTADVELANFSQSAHDAVTAHWAISDDRGETVASGVLDAIKAPIGNGTALGELRLPLESVTKATRLTITVSLAGIDAENSWDVWVYPDSQRVDDNGNVVVVTEYGDKLFNALATGGRVLFLPEREEIVNQLDGRFVPIFWSPVHFTNQPGSVGAIIDAEHPALADFPTSTHTDWQWWELLAESTSVDLDALDANFPAIVRFIDKFDRNALPGAIWEASVGDGRLLVCALDIESDLTNRIVAAQLRKSLVAYAGSDRFDPQRTITTEQLASLFERQAYSVKLTKGVAHSGYPMTNVDDGDHRTFWHSDWSDPTNSYPYHIDLTLPATTELSGVEYTARPDESNGRVREYAVLVATENTDWQEVASGTLEDTARPQRIEFASPIKADRLRLVALSEVNGASHCSIAELRPLWRSNVTDVDELGLIDGLNTNTE